MLRRNVFVFLPLLAVLVLTACTNPGQTNNQTGNPFPLPSNASPSGQARQIKLDTFKPQYCVPDTSGNTDCICPPWEETWLTCGQRTDDGGQEAVKIEDPNFTAADIPKGCSLSCWGKPVIYLYPTNPTLVDVVLTIPGIVTISDPVYPQEGWQDVLAHPDGTLFYKGNQYHELYYETEVATHIVPDNGIVVPSALLKPFLGSSLTKLGLITHEREEFIAYWLPKLEALNAPYVLFSVLTPEQKEVVDHVSYNPEPDTRIEFLAYFKPLQTPETVKPLVLPQQPPQRTGFTAVEWGGTIDEK